MPSAQIAEPRPRQHLVAGNRIFLDAITAQSRMRRGPDDDGLPRADGWARPEDVMSMGPQLYLRLVSKAVFGQRLHGSAAIQGALDI